MTPAVAATVEPAHLPALVSRAGQRLLDARNSAEVMEARQIADLALHYAKVTNAANETHADCLRIITRAEIRMADEIDKGQARGELAPAHRPEKASAAPTLSDLGVRRDQVHEWRATRDAGPEVVERAIQGALGEGRAPTKADIAKHVRGTFGTGDNEWYTPREYLDAARDVLGGFDLDPASSALAQKTVQAGTFFTRDDDGLSKEWRGRVWLNPPYAQPHIGQFVSKMVAERLARRVTSGILLTHNYTDTTWFHEAAGEADAICFTRGRIRFIDGEGNLAAPTQGQAFFYFGNDTAAFAQRFRSIGLVVIPHEADHG